MTKVYVLRVGANSQGRFGDIVPVIVDEGRQISDTERQALAQKLKAPETVFVNDIAKASIGIVHSQGEVDFAGVPALGVAWLLTKLVGRPIKTMKSRGGDIAASQDGEITWVRANLATMPPWHHKRLESAGEVEAIKLEETADMEHTMVWAWIDEQEGRIRARTFASDWDIPEAQGNGSGSMMLAAMLNRSIEITHGEGSVIFAKPASDNYADIGGRVIEESSINI